MLELFMIMMITGSLGSQFLSTGGDELITCKNDRMLELLWFIGYCGEFPSQLAVHIGGHPEWNRHLKYEAIKKEYVSVFRGEYQERTVRSLRLTDKGIDYISQRDPKSLVYVLVKNEEHIKSLKHVGIEKVVRRHATATALIMAHNAGAIFLPDRKPSIYFKDPTQVKISPIDPGKIYFYSSDELRAGIQEFDKNSVAKTSRLLGIIIAGHRCYCLYYTGYRRMFWRKNQEENTVAAIDTMLARRGFKCTVFSQVIIASNMRVSAKLAKIDYTGRSKYYTVSDEANNCFFVENSMRGDQQLGTIIDLQLQQELNRKILQHYNPPPNITRNYDAVTKDGRRPVILGYLFDLIPLVHMSPLVDGFPEAPVILCFDYQVSAIQTIVGPLIAVCPIEEANI